MSPRVVWAVDWPWLLVLWPVLVLKGLIVLMVWAFKFPFTALSWALGLRRSRK